MKKYATAFILAASLSAAASPMKVMTYNIRYSAGDRNSADNNWEARRDDLANLVESANPDVAGFQEVLPDQRKWLETRFPGYVFVGEGRNADRVNGESSPIAFRKDRFESVKSGTFWLSETPDKPSKGWDAACFRTATWTLVKDKRSGKKFYFIDTHLDHKGTEARRLGIQVIIDKIAEINKQGLPIVLVGDFNMEYDHPSMAPAREQLQDARRTAMKSDDHFTFNGWGRSRDSIDFIWYSGFSSCPEYETVTKPYMDRTYISDHFPVKAKLLF